MKRLQLLLTLLLAGIACGCGMSRDWVALADRSEQQEDQTAGFRQRIPERIAAFATRFRENADPLALDKEQMSPQFRTAKKKLSNPDETMLAFARWKEDIGHFAEAKRRYREILTDNPDRLQARLGIARIENETGRFDQSREILLEARKHNPETPIVFQELGRLHGNREEWADAIRYLNEAANMAPDDQTVRYELGIVLARAARYDKALPHLKYAVGESAALYNVGYILHEQGQNIEASRWIENALRAHPDERTQQLATELLAELQPARTNPAARVAAVGRPMQQPAASARQREYSSQVTEPGIHPVARTDSSGVPARIGAHSRQIVGPQTAQNRTIYPPGHATASAAPPQWRP